MSKPRAPVIEILSSDEDNIVTLSSDEEEEAPKRSRPAVPVPARKRPEPAVVTLSSDEEEEAPKRARPAPMPIESTLQRARAKELQLRGAAQTLETALSELPKRATESVTAHVDGSDALLGLTHSMRGLMVRDARVALRAANKAAIDVAEMGDTNAKQMKAAAVALQAGFPLDEVYRAQLMMRKPLRIPRAYPLVPVLHHHDLHVSFGQVRTEHELQLRAVKFGRAEFQLVDTFTGEPMHADPAEFRVLFDGKPILPNLEAADLFYKRTQSPRIFYKPTIISALSAFVLLHAEYDLRRRVFIVHFYPIANEDLLLVWPAGLSVTYTVSRFYMTKVTVPSVSQSAYIETMKDPRLQPYFGGNFTKTRTFFLGVSEPDLADFDELAYLQTLALDSIPCKVLSSKQRIQTFIKYLYKFHRSMWVQLYPDSMLLARNIAMPTTCDDFKRLFDQCTLPLVRILTTHPFAGIYRIAFGIRILGPNQEEIFSNYRVKQFAEGPAIAESMQMQLLLPFALDAWNHVIDPNP